MPNTTPENVAALLSSYETRIAALEVLGGIAPATSGRSLVAIWGNEPNSERLTEIALTSGHPYNFKVVQSVRLENVLAGDLIDYRGYFQTNCKLPYNTMVASRVILAANPTQVDGHMIVQGNGCNIDKDIHHYVIEKQGVWVADQDYPELYLNTVFYTASTAATSGAKLTISPNYGRAVALVFR